MSEPPYFERNDEDNQDNMKTITNKNVDKNEWRYIRGQCVRYAVYLHVHIRTVYTSCISRPLSHLNGWMFILSISQVPLSTHIFLRKQVLIFKKVQFIQSPLFLKFIHPCDDNQPNWSHLSLFNIPSIDYGSLALGLHETDEATNEDHSCKPRQSRFNRESTRYQTNNPHACPVWYVWCSKDWIEHIEKLQQSKMTKSSYKSIKIKSHIRIDQRSMQQLFCFYHRCPRRQRRSAWNCCLVAYWLFQSLSWARRSWDETRSMDQLSVSVIFQYESVSIPQSQTKRQASNSNILKVVDIPWHSYTPQPSLQTWRPRCTASTWIDRRILDSANIEKLQPFSIQQDTVLYIKTRNYAKDANVGTFESLAKTGDSHGFTTTLESCCQLPLFVLGPFHRVLWRYLIFFRAPGHCKNPCQSHSSSISLVEIWAHLPSSQLEMGLNILR